MKPLVNFWRGFPFRCFRVFYILLRLSRRNNYPRYSSASLRKAGRALRTRSVGTQ